jgi:large repetitive protein
MSFVRAPKYVPSFLRIFVLALLFVAVVAPCAFAQESDLIVVKTGPDQANADSDVSYSIVVANGGPDDATAVSLSDTIPPGMTFVSESHDPAFSCSAPAVGGTGTVTCTSALFAANASANFTFVFHIDPATPPGTTFTNIANVSDPTDPNSENDSSTAVTSTPPPPQSDLGITKVGPSVAGTDTDVTYTITFINGGPDDAASGSWTDTLPGTMTFVSLTQNSGTPMSCTTGATVTCSGSPVAAGESASFTLVTHIPAGTPAGTSFTNVASVSGGDDPNPENDTSQTSLVVSNVDIAVTKTGPPSVNAGSNASYVITITNNGPDTASNVSLTDELPPGTTFVSLNHDSGTNPSGCGTPTVGEGGTVLCTWVSLASGATSQFTLVINSGSAPSIANTASGLTDSFDTNPSNDSATANTTVTQSADLAVTKSGPGTVTAGTDVTYTLTITNNGPSIATSVSLSDTLPAGLTFVSVNQTSGPTFGCSGGPTTTCTIASLASGATATFDLVAHVSSATAGGASVANTATGTTSTTDPTPGNNSSTSTATAAASADVSVTKNGPAAVAPGSDITYAVTVANAGPSDAANVQLIDNVPAGTTFVSANQTSGPTFNCVTPAVGGTGPITCSIASLVAGASAAFDFVMHVDPSTTGTISNTATATSTTTDPTPGNGTATSPPATVSPSTTDVSLTKTANGERFSPSSNVTYTITATNNGPAVATNVVVTDILPAGTTFVSATPSQGSCSGTTTVTCNLGVLLPSTSATIALVVTLPPTFAPVVNTATVTSDNPDSNPANNTATSSIAVSSAIPSLSPLALALLALALAAVGLFVTRMQ